MKIYVGDLDKGELIEAIYYEFIKSVYKENYMEYELPSEVIDNLRDKVFIRNVNGLLLNMEFSGDYIIINANDVKTYLNAIFKLKLEKCVLVKDSLNGSMFDLIKENEERLKELRERIDGLTSQMNMLGFSNPASIVKNKKVIRNNYYDSMLFTCYKLWQERKGLQNEFKDLYFDNISLVQNMINSKGRLVRR